MTVWDALRVEWDATRSVLVTFCVLMAFDTLSARRLTFGSSTTPSHGPEVTGEQLAGTGLG